MPQMSAFRLSSSVFALLFSIAPLWPAQAMAKTQYVVISFDGAHDNAQWDRSRRLARKTGARFTYFLSCVYLLSPENRGRYQPPGLKAGRSNVGFGESREDVSQRLRNVWRAHLDSHEIASHGCGHFDGKGWSAADWASEFEQFSAILRDAWRINGTSHEPPGWRRFAATTIRGFRAPYLSTGAALDHALAAGGFTYDASGVSRGPVMPASKGGIWRFALPMVPEGPSERRIIAMDYNLFVRHSGGFERPDQGGAFEERTYRAFADAFAAQYGGERVPLQIGFHFTLMNGGAYWRALERFAEETCGKVDVKCVSYRELLNDLEGEATGPTAGG